MDNFKVSITTRDGQTIDDFVPAENPGQVMEPVMKVHDLKWSEVQSVFISNINI